jgi:hypothetical protein
MAIPTDTASRFPSSHGQNFEGAGLARRVGQGMFALAAVMALCLLAVASASAGPISTRLVHTPGEIVPIPASIPHEEGDMVDKRILGDLRWIAARYPIYVTDGYSGPLPNGEHVGCNQCHVKGSDHYNGLAVDVVPLGGAPGKCDNTWAPITRLAEWAEPVQNQPVPPFRWVGYNGDAGHGCGNHLHISWQHSPAAMFQLAEWVEIFPTGPAADRQPRKPRPSSPPQKLPSGPPGGFGTIHSGGVSARGD